MSGNSYLNYLATVIRDDIDYVAIATDNEVPTETTDIATVNELDRIAATKETISGRTIVSSNFADSEMVTNQTTVSTGTSQTVFDVVSATGFNVGDRITVADIEVEITNIATNTITVDTALGFTPAGGEVVKQYGTQIHLVKGGSISPNTGETIVVAELARFSKTNAETKKHKYNVSVRGYASIDSFSNIDDPFTEKLLYVNDSGAGSTIYYADVDGTNAVALTSNGASNDLPKFSKSGDKVIYHSNFVGGFQIWIYDFATTTHTQMTNTGNCLNPDFSDDDSLIVFRSDRGGSYRLYTMPSGTPEPLGGTPTLLTNASFPITGAICHSYTDNTIYYSIGSSLYSIQSDDTANTLIRSATGIFNMNIAKDSSYLTYYHSGTGLSEIYKKTPPTFAATEVRLTNDGVIDGGPCPSVDGSLIYWESQIPNVIKRMNNDGTSQTVIINNSPSNTYRPFVGNVLNQYA